MRNKAGLLADYMLLLQGWTGTLPVGWNTPAWSLSCEVFFYACFPVMSFVLRNVRWGGVLCLALLVCVLPELMPRAGVPASWKPLIHVSDFAAGAVAARAYAMLKQARAWPAQQGAWLYLPAAGLGAALVAYPSWLGGRMEINTPLRLLNAALLVGLAVGGGGVARALSSRVAVYLGKSSYSMYILHVPILWWFHRLLPKLHLRLSETVSGCAFVGLVVLVSAAAFRGVEEPANRWLRKRLIGAG